MHVGVRGACVSAKERTHAALARTRCPDAQRQPLRAHALWAFFVIRHTRSELESRAVSRAVRRCSLVRACGAGVRREADGSEHGGAVAADVPAAVLARQGGVPALPAQCPHA
eukprot:2079356-Rhodomonas_salina.1